MKYVRHNIAPFYRRGVNTGTACAAGLFDIKKSGITSSALAHIKVAVVVAFFLRYGDTLRVHAIF